MRYSLYGLVLLALCGFPALGEEAPPVVPVAEQAAVAAAAAAQPATDKAKVVIEAPEEPVPPGQLVILDAQQSIGDQFLWSANLPLPAPVGNWAVDSGGRLVHFATPLTPGQYAWTLTVLKTAPPVSADQQQVVIVVGAPLPPPPLPRLLLSVRDVKIAESAGVGATSGIVRCEAPVAEALTVTLTVPADMPLRVPATVAIAAGEQAIGFIVDVVDDQVLTGDREVTIEAAATGYEAANVAVTVTDDEQTPVPPVVLGLVLTPTTVREGVASEAKVTRQGGNPAEALVVMPTTSDATEATVPASVIIPAGQAEATFAVTSLADSEVDGPQSVQITVACAGEHTPATAALIVQDADAIIEVTAMWGIAVYESGDVAKYGPTAAQVITGTRLRELNPKFTWLPADRDTLDEAGQVPADIKPWLLLVQDDSLELPYLFLVDQNGRIAWQGKLPESVDAVIAEVQKHLK
jgi:hypothetical protein